MAKDISGNVVNKISFEIDRRSWSNLDKFQKRIADVKKQLSGLSGNIKVNAVVSKFDRVQKAVGAKSVANKQQEYNAHVALFQKHQNKMAQVSAMNERRVENARNMMSSRLSTAGASDKVKTTAFNRFDTFSQQMLAGKMTATEFSRAVNQSTSSLLRQSAASKNAQLSMRGLRSELIQATAAYSAFAVGANIFKTGKEFDSLAAGMTLFAGNESGVKETMSFLRSESERLGTNFEQAAQAYTKFAIVSRNKLTQEETRGLFTGLSEYATVMQVDQYRFQRAMMAIQQMMSKGKISSEELRLQLAENLSGSVEIFARAMGLTEAEMFKQMEQGKILAEDVLPKVAKEYARVARENGALGKAQNKVNSQFQRFLNALTDIKIAMFEGGMGQSLADSFKIMASFLQDNKEGFAALGNTIGAAIKTVVSVLQIALEPIMLVVKAFNAMFGDAGGKILGTVLAITAMTRAVSMLAMGFALANGGFMALVKNIGKYGLITTAVLGAEDLYVGAQGGDALSKRSGLMDWMGKSFSGKAFAATSPLMWATGQAQKALKIDVTVNDGEFAKAVDVRVNQRDEDTKANLLAASGG